MGVLDDAIRDHLELKRRRGTADAELARQELEALGPVRRDVPPAGEEAESVPEPVADAETPVEPGPEDVAVVPVEEEPPAPAEPELPVEPEPEAIIDPSVEEPPDASETTPAESEDVLEETPDFLQETPEHDRLWFEQKPPRDFDFDE